MENVQFWKLVRLYGIDVLLLGLIDKLLRTLIKCVSGWQSSVAATIERLKEKRAAK